MGARQARGQRGPHEGREEEHVGVSRAEGGRKGPGQAVSLLQKGSVGAAKPADVRQAHLRRGITPLLAPPHGLGRGVLVFTGVRRRMTPELGHYPA